ncbi:IS481 family transposase [Ruminococcus sp. AM47-2BH]|jgi:transposase|nr:IS481 family transposase [Ruminococcus sp. AM47-2BH]
MNTVTQITRRRQAIIEYSLKKGVTKAARRYNVSRQFIYRWQKRYDGTLESLKDRSHRPHSHPNQHTQEEIKLIKDMRKRNMHTGLVVFWVKLRQKGYTRSVTSLWRMLKKLDLAPIKPPNPKYIPKPYEKMYYPGQRVQIDVKFVPDVCIVGEAKAEGKKFYQYTAIDEYSRFRYLEAFEEHSSYSSAVFLEHMLQAFKFPVECVQTDNGMEFTKRLGNSEKPTLTLFEASLKQRKIRHKLIKPYTPRHNGKVERSHRKDNEYFYAVHTFYSFEDFKKQLAVHSRKYNNFPMRPLNWKTPAECVKAFLTNGEVF